MPTRAAQIAFELRKVMKEKKLKVAFHSKHQNEIRVCTRGRRFWKFAFYTTLKWRSVRGFRKKGRRRKVYCERWYFKSERASMGIRTTIVEKKQTRLKQLGV